MNGENPAIVINFGIQKAISNKCIIMSPESIFLNNGIEELVKNTTDNTFCVGQIIFMTFKNFEQYHKLHLLQLFKKSSVRTPHYIGPVYFGSICCTKDNLMKINLYDENFNENGWGGEDDDIRNRLMRNNILMIENKNICLVHLEQDIEFVNRYNNNYINKRNKCINRYDNFLKIDNLLNHNLNKYIKNIKNIGNIDKIIEYKFNNIIMNDYPIILLTQAYNEENNVTEFLNNVDNFVDGIICLDDGSTDNTWELLNSSKLLLKVKKIRNIQNKFDDLENRNLLLKILDEIFIQNNININWIFWLDFDERIETDLDYVLGSRREILSKKFRYNILNIPFFHMWNESEYNTEYPVSFDGVQYHTRFVRYLKNKSLQIISDKKLHFYLNYYDDKKFNYIFPIKHLSYNTPEKRKYKYNQYVNNYDKDLLYQHSYEHILNDNPKLKKYTKSKKIYMI